MNGFQLSLTLDCTFEELCSNIKSSKKSTNLNNASWCSSKIMAKNDCLKMTIYTSELLNLLVETTNSIFEYIIDLF